MAGLEFHETMAGSYVLVGAEAERPMAFTVVARTQPLWSFFRRPEAEIEGEVDAKGLADHRPLRGTLGMSVLRKRTLEYLFRFTGNDDAAYIFDGTKHIDVRDLAKSMTVLPGAIRAEDGTLVARAVLRFDLRSDLVRFLRSFRSRR
jgi:hypothetical protein